MALTDFKITNYADNIAELPDTPSSSGISATQLKAMFDGRTNKEVKESINGIIEILSSVNGASNVSATPVKVDGADTVQGILDELEQGKIDKTAEADYMRISAYDTDEDGVVDNAMALAGQPIEYFETKEEADNRNEEVTSHLEESDLNHTNLKTDYEAFKEATTTDLANRVEKEEGKGLSKNDLTDELKGGYDDAVALKHWHDNKPALDSIPSGGVVNTLGNDDTTIPTSKAVADAIGSAGGGDMLKATYDSNNNGIVDNAEALEGKTLTQVVGMAVESAKQNVLASDVGAYTISQTDEVVGNALASAKAYADGVESNAKTYADTKTNTVLRDAKNYVDEKVGSIPIVEDTSYLPSYMAFCTNANTDSLDAAFGKNNEENIKGLGKALAMYAWFKGDSKEEHPFTNLKKCNNINEIHTSLSSVDEITESEALIDIITTSPYAGGSEGKLFRLLASGGHVSTGNSAIATTITKEISITEENINGTKPVWLSCTLKSSAKDWCYAQITLNGVVVLKVTNGVETKRVLKIPLEEYGITEVGTYSVSAVDYGKNDYPATTNFKVVSLA